MLKMISVVSGNVSLNLRTGVGMTSLNLSIFFMTSGSGNRFDSRSQSFLKQCHQEVSSAVRDISSHRALQLIQGVSETLLKYPGTFGRPHLLSLKAFLPWSRATVLPIPGEL